MTPKSRKTEPPLLKPSDFESIGTDFEILNTTTRTAFRKNVKSRLLELGEKEMVLEVPHRSCAQGHALGIRLYIQDPTGAPPLFFEATAKVESVESQSNDADLIRIALLQCDETDWAQLRKIFSDRQQAIDEFLRAAKG